MAPDGGVHGYVLDRPDKLPREVVELIGKNVAGWHFQPVQVDGKPVAARARMSLRIVAHRQDNGSYEASIGGTHFGDETTTGRTVTGKQRTPPQYPASAVQSRVSGTVYLLIKVGRQGQVDDAIAQQVNLGVVASDTEMEHWRRVLADAALKAARQWTFNPPTGGADVGKDYWLTRVPVAFRMQARGAPAHPDTYGQWELYVPGPQQPVPWFDGSKMLAGDVDALPDGGIYQLDPALHLTQGAPGHG